CAIRSRAKFEPFTSATAMVSPWRKNDATSITQGGRAAGAPFLPLPPSLSVGHPEANEILGFACGARRRHLEVVLARREVGERDVDLETAVRSRQLRDVEVAKRLADAVGEPQRHMRVAVGRVRRDANDQPLRAAELACGHR